MSVGVTVDPGDVQRRMAGFAAQLLDMRPFFASKGRLHGRRWLKENFESEGEWGGWAWPEWSAAYAAARPPGALLVLTGGLRRSVMNPTSKAGPDNIELMISHPFGGVDLAQIHNFGAPGANIPARPLIPNTIPASDIDALRDDVEEWVDDIAKLWGLT